MSSGPISSIQFSLSVQFSSITQLCLTLCDPMNYRTPCLPVHYQFLEFTQSYVRPVSDAIQLSHPLSFPSLPAFILSQHQGLFQGVSYSHQGVMLFSVNSDGLIEINPFVPPK